MSLGSLSPAKPLLGVEQARRYRRIGWSWLAILDFLAIAGFVGFIHADLIFAPGQPIELPESVSVESRRVEAVLSVHGEMLLFNGRVYRADRIDAGFAEYFEGKPNERGAATLLIKMDASASVSVLLELSDKAQVAGFSTVHVAKNKPATPEPNKNF